MKKINFKKLQESLNKDAKLIYEGLNTAESKKLYNLVVDLYEEINSFETDAPPAAINALSPHLNHVREMLENMLQKPMEYVSPSEDEPEKLAPDEESSEAGESEDLGNIEDIELSDDDDDDSESDEDQEEDEVI